MAWCLCYNWLRGFIYISLNFSYLCSGSLFIKIDLSLDSVLQWANLSLWTVWCYHSIGVIRITLWLSARCRGCISCKAVYGVLRIHYLPLAGLPWGDQSYDRYHKIWWISRYEATFTDTNSCDVVQLRVGCFCLNGVTSYIGMCETRRTRHALTRSHDLSASDVVTWCFAVAKLLLCHFFRFTLIFCVILWYFGLGAWLNRGFSSRKSVCNVSGSSLSAGMRTPIQRTGL